MKEIKLTIHPFEMDSLKEAAKKIQEEAGEAFVEFLLLHEGQSKDTTRLEDELSDCIQACCNMLMRYGADPQAAMERCEQRNRERGRYGDANTNGMRESSVGDTANHRRMDSDSGGNDSTTCVCDRSGVVDSDGSRDAHHKTTKSPEDMSVAELIEALSLVFNFGFSCKKLVADTWCKTNECISCRRNLLSLLKAAYEREMENAHKLEDIRFDALRTIASEKIAEKKRKIADLTHERDGLRRRLAELNEAGITSLHRLLRETVGEAKNVTHNACVYIEKQRGSKDEHCGSRRSDRRNHGGDCGAQCAGEHILPAEPPAQEMSEREKVVERLREIDFAQKNVSLNNIGRAVLGYGPAPWWDNESRAALRDKLIELLNYGE